MPPKKIHPGSWGGFGLRRTVLFRVMMAFPRSQPHLMGKEEKPRANCATKKREVREVGVGPGVT